MTATATASTDVTLVGFKDQANLGMGYLAATLAQHGRSVEMADYRHPAEEIVERVLETNPLVVGFSLIFQYYLPGYRKLAQALREAGVAAHFTMGGHYPSLCFDEVLESVPELDSVARFEGELTLVDLVDRLDAGEEWREVPGLAFRRDGEFVESEPRALIHRLDDLPHPVRPSEPAQVVGFRTVPMLASRGCARRCSFCSIHAFYRTAPGKVVRTREPAAIVAEMRELYEQDGITVFLFQDDDFPLWGKAGRRWVEALVHELHAQDLVGRVLWKISCRAEYVEPELFAMLRDAGLYLVYMGLESGTESGLEVLNKQISVEQNRAAIETLKELGILFEYGFMLFDPSSTFESVRENARFLQSIAADGQVGALFCRMLPYGGTPIRDRLREEGRLRGDVTRPDYDFLDPRLTDYHRLLDRAAEGWIHNDGVSHQFNWAWTEVGVLSRLAGPLEGVEAYREALAALAARSNRILFDLVERSSLAFEQDGDDSLLSPQRSDMICRELVEELLSLRNEFISENQDRLWAAIERSRVRGPIISPQIF
ncbi:MAG TPA: radical SAM protein [Solirubrobacterales bacterium]|nr:radical SAM protein [Solirubrobacterales bacterium]